MTVGTDLVVVHVQRLGLLDMDYNKVSAYGHFGKPSLPWEE